MLNSTIFATHPELLEHNPGPGHPERPDRLRVMVELLRTQGLLSATQQIRPEAADPATLALIHSAEHIEKIRDLSKLVGLVPLTADTFVCGATYKVALRACGAVLETVDGVLSGHSRNGFCAVRPPGHHAARNSAMGFCYFNNVAIAARHAQVKWDLDRIAIVDWDVHHGNGTQQSFSADPSIFFFSIHQFPHYPGTGADWERGQDHGLGFTLNAAISAGAGDSDYLRIFDDSLWPAMDRFEPELIIVSAGFDAHQQDPLGGMELSNNGFADITRKVVEIASKHCQGRVVSVLEGGYHLEATALSAADHLRVLLEG